MRFQIGYKGFLGMRMTPIDIACDAKLRTPLEYVASEIGRLIGLEALNRNGDIAEFRYRGGWFIRMR